MFQEPKTRQWDCDEMSRIILNIKPHRKPVKDAAIFK
jgi:hypothetical protein